MADVNRECLVTCKNCNETVVATWSNGFLGHNRGWQAKRCPKCKEKIELKNLKVIVCPHCGKVMEKSDKKTCLACGQLLAVATNEDAITCPGLGCGTALYIPMSHTGDYTCPICGTVLAADYIAKERAKKTIVEPQLIRLPDINEMQKEDWAIWKHPLSSFPFKSRLQVNEGTYALLLQNGVCQYPCGPGSYLLEETNLKKDQRIDLAMADENMVFNTDVYCVIKNLPEISWGAFTPDMEMKLPVKMGEEEETGVFRVKGNGVIAFQVSDAKAFAGFAGFGPVKRSELTRVSAVPGSQDGKLVELTRKLISDAMYQCVKTLCAAESLEPEKLMLRQPDVEKAMTAELDRLLSSYGLCVQALRFKGFEVEESQESREKRQARAAEKKQQEKGVQQVAACAESQFSWKAEKIILHDKDNSRLSAELSFSGICRLHVEDEAGFSGVPEVKRFIEQPQTDAAAAQNYFRQKAGQLIRNFIAQIAQDMINRERIQDLLESYEYARLADPVREALNNALAPEGLSVKQFTVNFPEDIVPSAALKAHLQLPKRKETVRRCAETPLQLTTAPILVHMRDDATVYVKSIFSGKARLRVSDEGRFFSNSDIQGLVQAEGDVSATAVTEHFTALITPLFTDLISTIAQAIVDQTNADIREMNRLNASLKESLSANLNDRVSPWGMHLESLDMGMPKEVEKSANLLMWAQMHETRSGTALADEIAKINNNHTIFTVREEGRVEVAVDTVRTETKEQLNQNRVREIQSQGALESAQDKAAREAAERAHAAKLDEIRKSAEIQSLVDEVAAGRKERDFAQIRKDYQQKYQLREDEIRQAIREAQLQQEGQIDAAARQAQAEFAKSLNEAEHKAALQSILRKIDESDLDWRGKLDEYERLRRKTAAETDADVAHIGARSKADAEQIAAESESRIQRDKNDIFYLVGETKIKLSAAEADLMEKIAQNAEDRQRRQANAEEDLRQRRAILDFDQRMQDRRESMAQQMEMLAQQYQQELALRDKDDALAEKDYELKKLQFILDYYTREVVEKAGVDKARFHSEEEIKKAEAQFHYQHEQERQKEEMERWKAQVAREDAIAQRADEFKRQLAEIQSALEKTRLENDRNRDNKQAEVAIAQANAQAQSSRSETARQLDKLEARMDELRKSMEQIRESVDHLKNKVRKSAGTKSGNPPPPSAGTIPGNSPPLGYPLYPPYYPPHPPVYSAVPSAAPATAASGEKKCPNCGCVNSIYATECTNCHNEL